MTDTNETANPRAEGYIALTQEQLDRGMEMGKALWEVVEPFMDRMHEDQPDGITIRDAILAVANVFWRLTVDGPVQPGAVWMDYSIGLNYLQDVYANHWGPQIMWRVDKGPIGAMMTPASFDDIPKDDTPHWEVPGASGNLLEQLIAAESDDEVQAIADRLIAGVTGGKEGV